MRNFEDFGGDVDQQREVWQVDRSGSRELDHAGRWGRLADPENGAGR